MTAAETIAAAMEKLEVLRKRATSGAWSLIGGNEYVTPIGITVAPDDGGVTLGDAELIVTLHRTIDAQLRVLRLDLIIRKAERPPYSGAALALAEAILGASA